MEKAVVTNIQGYSIHDGPGIRTVVFFKGCPLRCIWCANPENLSAKPQVGFLKNLCRDCARCAKHCPKNAIVPGTGIYRIDRSMCDDCGSCVEGCYYDALVRYGETMTSQEVYQKVRRDKMFYDSSGGGVTVSGGEPMGHSEFIFELFSLCGEEKINTCIETCGFAPRAAFERVLPVTDIFYFDLKLMDGEAHRRYTGRDNELILENARLVVQSGKKVLFRQPLIPGINDSVENIAATAEFMKGLGPGGMEIQLMPYHRAGQTKYDALGLKYETAELNVMTAQELESVKERYIAHGVRCTISK